MNYNELKQHCEENSDISRTVIDEFLIYYAAQKEKLEPHMEAILKKYNSTVRSIDKTYINFLKAEYIAHRIFRNGGYLEKYLNRNEIKNLPPEQYKYLEFQHANPWRYSFATIKNRPAVNFFEMEDVITGENYLLYSHGMSATDAESNPRLWFNLIANNGKCWQTFGLIIFLTSFSLDDIFFFATELNSNIEDNEMLMHEIENNPFPFFMLITAAALPVVIARGFETLMCYATDSLEEFSTNLFSTNFTVEWNKNVYQLTSKKMGEFPHFAIAYYDEVQKELWRSAATAEGFDELTGQLADAGIDVNPGADIVVSVGMLTTTQKILNKKINLNPYEKLFTIKSAGSNDQLNKINHFLKLAMPFYNSNKEPDIKKLADEAGLDYENAESIWNQTKQSVGKMKKNN